MRQIFQNWKTSGAGAALLALAIKIYTETGDWKQAIIPFLTGAIGILARDAKKEE